MTLKELEIGQKAIVTAVGSQGALRQHLLDMGIIPGTAISILKYAPMGDPMEVRVHGYSLSLRLSEAEQIQVSLNEDKVSERKQNIETKAEEAYRDSLHEHNSHPGLGESGKYHSKAEEHPLPEGTKLVFALAGQQNCGKTTLFNQLTGSNQHVGNFPGVTVERKEGSIKKHANTKVVDLPGIYSLSPYTSEEVISRNFIIEEKPQAIINIVDASNIERNLYLTMQLMELDVPMVLALNMMDEVRNNGGSIRINEMEKILGIPVVPVSASKNEGVDELIEHALHVAKYQEKPLRQDFCHKNEDGGAVHRCLHSIMHLIEDHAEEAGLPIRFAAGKLVEGDESILQALNLSQNEKETLEHILLQMEEERGMDRSAAIADMRFDFIHSLCEQTVFKVEKESKETLKSRKIDKILTGKWTAIPIFILVMCLVIWMSIDLLGAPLQDGLDEGIGWLAGVCETGMGKAQMSPVVISLVVDAIFGGVGSVLSFVPIIVILFFFLSLIEDSGYMARIAFVTDSLLRRLGLSGRSIVPLLIGFGCSVPAVMATRTLPSAKDRLKTILLTPFMSCSAKIPIFAFFTAAFFPGHGGLILIGLYLLSIIIGVIVALIGKHIGTKSEAAPFVMELPNYRMPVAKNTLHLMWDKTKDFCQRAFTIIFVATIVIWFLQSFNFRFEMVENGEGSMLAWLAGLIAPVFNPIGLGDWRAVTALISGFLAKESVVATMEVLNLTDALTIASAASMLIFSLLYTPCVAAIAAVRRELGGKWALFVVVFQCVLAWLFALITYWTVTALV
ncbi:MAG: ferrous iron transport protein B [Bacteroidales bacterium]|nr:ferrous iron transport protein B [Bacteroidales bacterium]